VVAGEREEDKRSRRDGVVMDHYSFPLEDHHHHHHSPFVLSVL